MVSYQMKNMIHMLGPGGALDSAPPFCYDNKKQREANERMRN